MSFIVDTRGNEGNETITKPKIQLFDNKHSESDSEGVLGFSYFH